MKKLLCLVLSLFFLSHLSHAQNPGTGAYPFASFDTPGFDSINLGNLNTRFTIPIVNRQGRGQGFNYSLQYEGLIWTNVSGVWIPNPSWGFRGMLNGAGFTGYITYTDFWETCPGPSGNHGGHDDIYSNVLYYDAFGGIHSFDYSLDTHDCPEDDGNQVVSGDGSSNDGSGYKLLDLGDIQTRSGSIIRPSYSTTGGTPVSITDRNGNQISGSGSGTYTDTLGVTALSVSGSNPVSFTYPVTRQANGASTATASLSYQTHTVRTNFGCSGVVEYGSTSVSLPYRLTLADGSYYEFSYEGTYQATDGAVTGRLGSVRLPTGGTIQYSYTAGCSGAGINADGTVGSLARVTSGGTRSYGRAPINGNATTTTLQDEKGNQTLISLTIDSGTQNFYETHRTVHQGNTSQPALSDVSTCYNNTATPCDSTAITLPISEVDTTSSYNGGSQTITKNYYDTNGSLLTESDVLNGSTLLNSIKTSYNALGEPLNVTKYDASGSSYASTTYGYDETGLTGTSGLPQHTTATGQRGNLTSSKIEGSPDINTSTTYYDTGMPASSTAADGGQTTYTYDSTGAFVTGTNLPTPSSHVALSTSANYDAYSASLLSSTGMNAGETTAILSYDPTMSPTSVQLPSSGVITVSHDSPTQITTTQALDSSRTANTKTILDGYGRVSRSSIWNGQSANSWYNTDYCYDSVGLLAFQSVAYQASSYDPSAVPLRCSSGNPGTSYSYDALGRKLSRTTADGTTSWSYLDHAVKSVDVTGVGRITQYDALGRLSSVCELSTSTLVGVSPTDCGSNIAGTGFLTTYTYNPQYHVTQGNQGGQFRTFFTDAAGRITSVTEPESGTTNYSYAYNSTGLVSTRTRPAANQNGANTLTTTTTQYDLLGRPVSVTYSDGTPRKLFFYDINANLGNGFVQTNYLGRLSAMEVQPPPNRFSLTGISYDSLGRVIGLETCLLAQCGTNAGNVTQSYQYDGAGNLLSSGDGAATATYAYSPANEVQSLTTSLSGPMAPPTILSNVTNGPNGPLNYSLGNGLTSVFTYDALGRNNLGTVCQGSTAPNCSGGGFVYSSLVQRQGVRATSGCDTVLNQCFSFGYDEFNRLTSRTVTGSGAAQNFTYGYDRYGNRWSQTAANGGPQPQLSFSSSTNQIITAGYSYDAAGNLSSDGIHFYTYDAEGNLTAVDGGTTAQYVYDALNRRISSTVAGTTTQFLYNAFGQRVSIWDTASPANLLQEQYFVGSRPVAYLAGGMLHFQHQDWTGTERMRTTYTGAVEGSFVSMPFGDAFSTNGSEGDAYHYAGLDHDSSSNTDHARFRQYSSMSGRWMSPDPYRGSYHWKNPQSLNRYAYALNNPVSFTDPSGLDLPACGDDDPCDGGGGGDGGGGDGGGDGGDGGGSGGPINCNDPNVVCVTAPEPEPEPDPNPNPGICYICGAPHNPISIPPLFPATNNPQRMVCTGSAYVLAGNPANVGQTGFPNTTVTNGSAAVIPRQFTGQFAGGPFMRQIGASTFGTVTGPNGATESFNTITQAVGNAALGTALQAQNIIMGRDPGALVVEIVGGANTWKNAGVTINMPSLGQGCPAGTHP